MQLSTPARSRNVKAWNDSVKQILPPLIVALTEQAHQMTARMQRERTRRALEFEASFVRRPVAFAVIARMAAGDQIFPGGFSGAGPQSGPLSKRQSVSPGLVAVRQRARERKKEKFTNLLHHLTIDLLKTSYYALQRKASPGVD